MLYREAVLSDIPKLQQVRLAVKENVLSTPDLVTYNDYVKHITLCGKGWVCEDENTVVGFAIANVVNHNIWALFVLPGYEEKGIGKTLHRIMLDWYFTQTDVTVWLSTAFGTRAEKFYGEQGWHYTGLYSDKEAKFEMTATRWKEKTSGSP